MQAEIKITLDRWWYTDTLLIIAAILNDEEDSMLEREDVYKAVVSLLFALRDERTTEQYNRQKISEMIQFFNSLS